MAQENRRRKSPRRREAEAGKFTPNDPARKRPKSTTNEEMQLPEQNRKLGKRHD